ncbi:MAG: hypothetical protein VX189_05120, partial [Planctomycetota bacterium]|nr:hypothetical protein [Planctomycetota bacterium]
RPRVLMESTDESPSSNETCVCTPSDRKIARNAPERLTDRFEKERPVSILLDIHDRMESGRFQVMRRRMGDSATQLLQKTTTRV